MTDTRVTQVSLEQWAAGNPPVQITQTAVEMWAVGSLTTQALVTQTALEMWVPVATAAPVGRPRRVQNVNYR